MSCQAFNDNAADYDAWYDYKPWVTIFVPVYSRVRLLSKDVIKNLLYQAGFKELEFRTILCQSPGESHYKNKKPAEGYPEAVGLVAIGGYVRD